MIMNGREAKDLESGLDRFLGLEKARILVVWVGISTLFSGILVWWLWGRFGWPWDRFWQSLQYWWQCKVILFSTSVDEGSLPVAPVASSDFIDVIRGNVENFAFMFRSGSVAMVNPVCQLYSLAELGNNFNSILRVVVWLPYIPLFTLIFSYVVTEPRSVKGKDGKYHDEPIGETNAAKRIDDLFIRFYYPLEAKASLYVDWLSARTVSSSDRNYRAKRRKTGIWFVYLWVFLALLFSGYLCDIMDLWSFWFVFCKMQFKASAISVFVSFIVTTVSAFYRLGPFWDAVIIGWAVFRALRKECLDSLVNLLEKDLESLAMLPISILIVGEPNVGKTKLLAMLGYLCEYLFRDKFKKLILNYRSFFPFFHWETLERWVMENTLTPSQFKEIEETGHLPKDMASVKERAKLVTRIDIEDKIVEMYQAYRIGKGDFFGYDKSAPLSFFDGVKNRTIYDTVINYACVWFLYYPDVSLIVSNFPVKTDPEREGTIFPDYASPEKRIRKGCRASKGFRTMSAIANMDANRIYLPTKDDPNSSSAYDCEIELLTEMDKEYGAFNGFAVEKELKGKGIKFSNPAADGTAQRAMLMRHGETIDNIPFVRKFGDTQKMTNLTPQIRNSYDAVITVTQTSESVSVLPFHFVFDAVFGWLEGHHDRWLFEFQKYRPEVVTGYNHILDILFAPWKQHAVRMANFYSYQTVMLVVQTGVEGDSQSTRTMVWYTLPCLVYADLYMTDCYKEISDSRKRGMTKGRLQSEHYEMLSPSEKELNEQNSNFVKMFEAQKAVDQRIKNPKKSPRKASDADPCSNLQ